MSVLDLRNLHKLHLIDTAILDIKKRAANLDPGRAIQTEIAKLTEKRDAEAKELHAYIGEQKDLELRQKGIDDKIKKIDADLYGGKIVNPREVENLQKEIANLKAQRNKYDDRLLELMELIPPAQKALEPEEKAIAAKQNELQQFQKKVVVEKKKLEEEYRVQLAARPVAEKAVTPAMLAKYNAVKLKAGGIGMADVRKNACAACGMNLPPKLIEGAKEGRMVVCEACHRILYATDGLV